MICVVYFYSVIGLLVVSYWGRTGLCLTLLTIYFIGFHLAIMFKLASDSCLSRLFDGMPIVKVKLVGLLYNSQLFCFHYLLHRYTSLCLQTDINIIISRNLQENSRFRLYISIVSLI